jgi:hypothetical protein
MYLIKSIIIERVNVDLSTENLERKKVEVRLFTSEPPSSASCLLILASLGRHFVTTRM